MVNPGPSMRQLRLQESKRKHRSNKRSHPADIREGVAAAVMCVKEVGVYSFFFNIIQYLLFYNELLVTII